MFIVSSGSPSSVIGGMVAIVPGVTGIFTFSVDDGVGSGVGVGVGVGTGVLISIGG